MTPDAWVSSFLQAVGSFFLNPLLYYALAYVVILAAVRIKMIGLLSCVCFFCKA